MFDNGYTARHHNKWQRRASLASAQAADAMRDMANTAQAAEDRKAGWLAHDDRKRLDAQRRNTRRRLAEGTGLDQHGNTTHPAAAVYIIPEGAHDIDSTVRWIRLRCGCPDCLAATQEGSATVDET